PCRWNFALVEEKRPGFNLEIIEHERNTQILSSKDLCLIHRLKEYVDAGVNAFKLEGRMKSLYYAANITRMYRLALDTLHSGNDPGIHAELYDRELDLVSHRPYTDNLFNEFTTMENRTLPYIKKAEFLGYITEADGSSVATVKPFNPVNTGDTLDIIYPVTGGRILDATVTVNAIYSAAREITDNMAKPGELARITFSGRVYDHGILRKRKESQGPSVRKASVYG
ncbi:MAG: U32 family peptidase, partial [Spirochaetota bacterium]